MPKKRSTKKKCTNKNIKKDVVADFTIDDCANALKPVRRIKKSMTADLNPEELSWDQIDQDDIDIVEEIDSDGNKNVIYKKKRNNSKSEQIDHSTGTEYPEIVWYLISQYIKPEEVGRFACLNKTTYAITKREMFWRRLYKRYCHKNLKLPERLKIANSDKVYGLRQRVIRALYHTYKVFTMKVMQQAEQDSQPHKLVKRRCVNVWYCKGSGHWSVFFKFKKFYRFQRTKTNFIEELGRIDANPEEDAQVLQVTCQSFYEVPPLMGMTLSSVSVVLSQGFRHHRLHLGFNSGHHNVSKNILPECTVVLDTVVNMYVYDWWHPRYPHFETKLQLNMTDEESLPVLKKDFLA